MAQNINNNNYYYNNITHEEMDSSFFCDVLAHANYCNSDT